VKSNQYRSIMALPIFIKSEQIGCMVLLQEVSEAFNKEMAEIIRTFVSQASISLENAKLLGEAIENERYKEQLNIAKSVQKSLLPEKLKSNEYFEIAGYSMAADEVGGDYYDLIPYQNDRYGLIIGDVSGKGTSAAFNMAQMKGVFYSLAQMALSPKEFISKANLALSNCLEKSSFITASYFDVQAKTGDVSFVRAGHCPTLVYCQSENQCKYLSTKGMGLGLLRNESYDQFIFENSMNLASGDIIVLYTDGITEASNPDGKQFGESGLQHSFLKHVHKPPTEISEGIIEDLFTFLGDKKLDDDYTLVILKRK
ncbi:MAG: PP2C family protein-serine/threonine phosphatase, partial [Bacteroidota bacterium]